jgi:DNA invertase Pin-like site-specific DNA recombinase
MKKTIYGYARVSSEAQNVDRQIDLLRAEGIKKEYILIDKVSGKDFNRSSYLSLVGTHEVAPRLQEGNLLVVTSLDRLGRNYKEIKEQWDYITKVLKADIRVLDIPLLDTSANEENLDKRFIADLVLQILSYTAEKEKLNIKTRQAQGIASAKQRGKTFGRPTAEYPSTWEENYSKWKSGEITATKAMEIMQMKRTTFYKLVKKYENK